MASRNTLDLGDINLMMLWLKLDSTNRGSKGCVGRILLSEVGAEIWKDSDHRVRGSNPLKLGFALQANQN